MKEKVKALKKQKKEILAIEKSNKKRCMEIYGIISLKK
jgi:hypothetical protein